MCDLAGQELEEAVELVGVPPQGGGEGSRILVRSRLERPGTMGEIRTFGALSYATAAAPLERIVAARYDVISAEERRHYLALDPHNVVPLTLPESEEKAARELREWRAEGVLERDAE